MPLTGLRFRSGPMSGLVPASSFASDSDQKADPLACPFRAISAIGDIRTAANKIAIRSSNRPSQNRDCHYEAEALLRS